MLPHPEVLLLDIIRLNPTWIRTLVESWVDLGMGVGWGGGSSGVPPSPPTPTTGCTPCVQDFPITFLGGGLLEINYRKSNFLILSILPLYIKILNPLLVIH